jgi:magnesium-transporting ATPase (P-type)
LQILWVNMVSSVALAMSLAFEPPERDVMRRPPRDRAGADPVALHPVAGAARLGAVLGRHLRAVRAARAFGDDVETARTMALNTLVAMEVFYLFSVRYRRAASLTWEGREGHAGGADRGR